MAEITFRSDNTVELVDCMANDAMVANAARISTGKDSLLSSALSDREKIKGLIGYLMRNRHGTPFEHNSFTFRIECPIFVAREFMRHRMVSYNEVSGRYSEILPAFWVPAAARPLVQEGKPGHYVMKPGTRSHYVITTGTIKNAAIEAYNAYEYLLGQGICREVARAALPVSVYTSFYATMNARSLMNFLSLRVDDPDAAYPSKPQYEIEQAALAMEDIFRQRMPLTHAAFTAAGRVAP